MPEKMENPEYGKFARVMGPEETRSRYGRRLKANESLSAANGDASGQIESI